MHTVLRSIAAAIIGVVLISGPALASRPACDQLVAARSVGQSNEDIAKSFGTTRANVEACVRIAQQHERQTAARDRFHARRADRALSTP